jgi:hypothetical protein
MSTTNNENTGLGACDRCRGQKLRCTGAADPVPSSDSRCQRNRIPCARCQKAKVDCFSVKPAPRRPTVPHVSPTTRTNSATQSLASTEYQRQDSSPRQHDPNQDEAFADMHCHGHPNLLQDLQQARSLGRSNIVPTQALSSISDDWMMPITDNDLAHHGLRSTTPSWTIESAPVIDGSNDHPMAEPTHRNDLVVWSSDLFQRQDHAAQQGFGHLNTDMSLSQEYSHPDRQSNHAQVTSQGQSETSDSANACIHDIARLNERLLVEKSGLKSTPNRNGHTSVRPAIGQILKYSQEFVSILQRFESWCSSIGPLLRGDASSTQSSDFAQRGVNSSRSARLHLHAGSTASSPLTASLIEIPALLSMLSCYTCIVELFEVVFTPIHDAITKPTPAVLATLTELSLDGFDLDNHYDLQLECLTSVSLRLLKKMEDILIGSPEHEGVPGLARGDDVARKICAGFLDAVYVQCEQPEGHGKRVVRVETLVRDIRAALKATVL